jgi:hypothetical protein
MGDVVCIPHSTSGSSSSGSNMGVRGTARPTMWNAGAGAPEAFNMDSLKAGLDMVETMNRNHADLKGRVGKLEGRMENWEKKLNEFKSTFVIDTEIDFMTSCSKVMLDNMKTQIKILARVTPTSTQKSLDSKNQWRTSMKSIKRQLCMLNKQLTLLKDD